MSEENVKRQIVLPWVSFDSDAESSSPEGVFLNWSPHPRAYGNFARLLGKYVRDEKRHPARRSSSQTHLISGRKPEDQEARNDYDRPLRRSGNLRPGHHKGTMPLSKNLINLQREMVHVFVNGEQVLRRGEHTGAFPGRVVRGPGYRPSKQ